MLSMKIITNNKMKKKKKKNHYASHTKIYLELVKTSCKTQIFSINWKN